MEPSSPPAGSTTIPSSRRTPLPWLLIGFGVLTFALYGPWIGIARLGDDYDIYFEQPRSKLFYFFTHANPFSFFYRPIEAMFSAAVQTLAGDATWPIQVTQIGIHAMLAAWVAWVVLRLGYSRLHALLGGGLMAISQACVFAVMSNDTLSQIGATGCGCIALTFLWLAAPGATDRGVAPPLSVPYYGASLLFVVLALLFKESGLSIVPMYATLCLALNLRRTTLPTACVRCIKWMAPVLLLAGAYMVLRFAVVPFYAAPADQPMAIRVGLNIPKNLAMLAFAIANPAATDVTYVMIKTRAWAGLGAVAVGAAGFVILVAAGLWRAREERVAILLILALAFLSFFPHALLGKVGELYAYNAMPFVAILAGIGLGHLWEAVRSHRVLRSLLTLFLATYAVSNVLATRHKSRQVHANGIQAQMMLDQLREFASEVPSGGTILIRNPPSAELNYSIFRMPGLHSLPTKWDLIAIVIGRPDLTIQPRAPEQFPEHPSSPNVLLITLDGNRLARWPATSNSGS